MFGRILKKIFGSKNDRELKKLRAWLDQIDGLEPTLQALSDEALRNKTVEFKERLAKGASLDDLLPEAFAVVREASRRVLGMRHFRSQMIGGMVLHQGKIAEMKTGEGKTLVATLPAYLNALEGKGVHIVTVNDYLARRDAEWMGRIHRFLGLTVGVIIHGLSDRQRQMSYAADITYGTNNEFGFDYLRDHMKFDLSQCVQRDLHYAIVDEVDSILIDEARTPLIISGPSEATSDQYLEADRVIPYLTQEVHYKIDEKSRTVVLLEEGVAKVEELLKIGNLYDASQIQTLHHVNQALRAHTLYRKGFDYLVENGEVVIVDEFTGRKMAGRRWSDGLHQAVEAKEGVKIESENQTLATVSLQNYFRMFRKLAGMTGTADTEAVEFNKIYDLDVLVIPTHRPMVRKDEQDLIYKNEKGKIKAIVAEIEESYKKGQPVLVGTISVEKSEVISDFLKRRGIPHHVLNAKYHEREAEIVAQAGRYQAVTVATNMAGRGTDILLGGNPEFLARAKVGPEASQEEFEKALEETKKLVEEERKKVISLGGLRIIGTERHESRRIDNQLRGRAGRQGDPGSSRFYISLEDDLIRIFGSDRIASMMDRLGMEEDEPIFHPWITKALENAQKRVEAHNFGLRKTLIEYDDVMNQQRKTIYQLRREILNGKELREKTFDFIDRVLDRWMTEFEPLDKSAWNVEGLNDRLLKVFATQTDPDWFGALVDSNDLGQKIFEKVVGIYQEREKRFGVPVIRRIEQIFLLQTIDALWKDHLLSMDHLREGIGLRGYAQRDPIIEYKQEGYSLFHDMMYRFAEDSLEKLFHVQIQIERVPQQQAQAVSVQNPEAVTPTPAEPQHITSVSSPSGARPSGSLDQKQPVLPQDPSRSSSPSGMKDEPVRTEEVLMQAPSAMDQLGRPARPMQTNRESPSSKNITGSFQREEAKVGRNDFCPCGSGKKYKKCHGA